jgi:DNA (cytosine-5)-methyltransferase 1
MTTALNTASSAATYDLLAAARRHRTQAEIARHLGVDVRTVRRWELRQSNPPPYAAHALQTLLPLQLPLSRGGDFTFIDLFAGIGGTRLAFESVGGRCVFTSEWDTYAQKTYLENFSCDHGIAGDIRTISEHEVPDHDVLVAGFPCQPFSIAGVSKKKSLGRTHGFEDDTQGTLFFDIARIISHKRPRAFLLENVKNLKTHDRGRTFDVIRRTLVDELGYDLHVRVVDGAAWVPQHRERILLVGFRDAVAFDWGLVKASRGDAPTLRSILHRTDGLEPRLPWDGGRYFDHEMRQVPAKYTLTPHLWRYLQEYKRKHAAAGNGFGFGLVGPDSIARTLSARYFKDGSEILVSRGAKVPPRRLTPRECARLMGFPDSFRIPVSDTRAYKQFGNSVVVPAIRAVALLMKPFVCRPSIGEPELAMFAV